MERFHPEFVRELDAALKEVNAFVRKECSQVGRTAQNRRNFSKSPHGYLQAAIKDILRNSPEPVRLYKIIRDTGGSPSSVIKAVSLLHKRGQIERVRRGYYKKGPVAGG